MLADDNRAILDELETLLCSEFEIAGSVSEAGSVLQVVFSLKPNIVICDLDINGFSGIDFGHAILEKRLCAAVIILTMYNEPDLIYRALQAGIRGYVFKVDAGEELITALYTVEAGGQYLSRSIAARTRNGDAEDQSSPGG
ncbi:MAG: response regulator transcription factor [Acidobacteriia bacterium]|nr:response regulator transcription factor [Terriglobia bacterium]